MHDILTEADVEKFVRQQYSLLLSDDFTKSKFAHLDLESHFPRIIGFWKMIIFSQPMSYTGNAFDPHTKLNLEKVHFEKWNQFLEESIKTNFEGPNAQKVLDHAKLMTAIFQSKLGIK